MTDACDHTSASTVFNASSVPVRLICTCGEEWRVVPVDALVTLNPVIYARSLSGPMSGLVKLVKCRTCRKPLDECECVPGPRGGVAA